MAKKNNLDFIKVLSQRGLRILPVTRDKVPLVKGGYAAASTDLSQIDAWNKQFPNCTWGIQTGRQSSIVVIDLDPRNGSAQTVIDLMKQGHTLPKDAPCVFTPQKGYHYYFKYPANLSISSHTNLLDGLDVISDGKFIMAPCSESIHGFYSKADIDPSTLPDLPDWLVDLIVENDAPTLTSIPVNSGTAISGDITPKRGELSKATYRFIAIGHIESWNDELYKASRDCFEQGYTLEETIPMLEPATKASDPTTGLPRDEYLGYFDKKDLRTIESAFSKAPRYEPRTTDTASGASLYGPIQLKTDSEGLAQGDAQVTEPLITAASMFGEVQTFLTEKKTICGVETGLEPFDKLLGGLRPNELTAVHAESKSGKSTFIHKLIHCLLKKGHKVGYASREMDPKEEVMPSLISLEGQYNAWKEKPKLTDKDIPWLPNLYFSPGYSYFPLNEMVAWFEQMAKNQVKLIFYDHLHFGLSNPEDHQSAAIYIRELKMLAKKYGLSIVVIIQANKIMDGMRLGKNTVKGGAAITQTVNTLFTLERISKKDPRYIDAENITRVELVDKRHTQSKYGEFFLQYNEETTDLEVVTVEEAGSLGPTFDSNVLPMGRKY